MMNLTQANNDVLIAESDVQNFLNRDGKNPLDGIHYVEAAVADARIMRQLTQNKDKVARRNAQSGVNVHLSKIEDIVISRLPLVWRDGNHFQLKTLAKWPASVQVSIDEQTTKSGWRYMPTGKLKLTVGSYGDRKSYPQKKDGSFSYAKIAEEIVSRLDAEAQRWVDMAKAERAKRGAQALVDELNAQLGLENYVGLFSSERGTKHGSNYITRQPEAGKVFMTIGVLQVTPEQAVELYGLLQRIRAENK